VHRPLCKDNTPLVIRPVLGKADLDTFIRLPGRLQHGDAQWIEPLHLERREHLSPRNPVFAHLEWQAWIAWAGSEPVGRITAQVDQLHRQLHGADTGHFGMLDAIDDPAVFAALMATAEQWLLERGAHRITGPFNLTINEESGLLVEGFDRPPVVMMGHAPPSQGARIEALGFRPAADLLAYWMTDQTFHFPPRLQRVMGRWREHIHIRPLDRRRFRAEMQLLRDIFNDAWSENWGFVPFTEAEFATLGNNLRLLVPDDLLYIAEVDGEACAFIVALPNLNEAIAPLQGHLLPFGWARLLWRLKVRGPGTARVPLMGVRKAHQAAPLALYLIEALHQPCLRHGIRAVELSWILESNSGMRHILEQIGAAPYKRYRVYEKHI